MNSGGEKLTAQETRNALFNGKFNQLCLHLSKNDKFRKMWNIPLESEGEETLLKSERYRTMEDVELVLRFFAYRHLENFPSTIDPFLDQYLKQANNYTEETLKELETLFNDTINLIYSILDNKAFISPPQKRNTNTPVKTVYDPIMQVFANYLPYQKKLLKNKTDIQKSLYSDKKMLYLDEGEGDKFLFNGKYNHKKYVEARMQYYYKILQKYIT